jgi:peptidoglycan/LPS O-acetylase OafA/YrhL
MTPIPEKNRVSIVSIQILRALAALLVLCMHELYMAFPQQAAASQPTIATLWQLKSFGGIGVQIFFVVSGFIMAFLADKDQGRPFKAFMLDRVTRLVPLYWLTTCFWLLYANKWDLVTVVKSFLFIPVAGYFPVNGVGWTLVMEAFFYVVFGLIVIRFKLSAGWVAAAFGVLGSLSMAYPDNIAFAFYSDPIVWCFVSGIAIFHIHRLAIVVRMRYAFLFAGLVGMAYAGYWFIPPHAWGKEAFVPWGAPSALLVLGCVAIEAKDGIPDIAPVRWLTEIGNASYSLYMIHVIVIGLINRLILRAATKAGWTTPNFLLVVYMTTAVVLALIAYRIIEKPLTKAARSVLHQITVTLNRKSVADAPTGQA